MTTVRLIHGDCLEHLAELSGVGAIVTDPPYGIGRVWKGDDLPESIFTVTPPSEKCTIETGIK